MKTRRVLVGLAALVGAAALPVLVYGQGLILPAPVRGGDLVAGVQRPNLKQQRVQVEINEQVAQVQVSQTFVNPNSFSVEGVYYFPLPHGAQVSSFAMFVDGKKLEGEMLSAADARKIYDDIVRRHRDPALLEYVDYQLFRANIFPMPAHGERKIELSYEQILQAESGTVQFIYPLRGEMGRRGPVPAAAERATVERQEKAQPRQVIDIELRASLPLQNLYSPSHKVEVRREGDRAARVSFEGDSGGRDFVLVYSFSDRDFGLSLMTHRPSAARPGFFMLLLSPRVELPKSRVLPKDVIFVLDTSGSMQGEKMRQAREALRFCVEHLAADDRFNLVTFSSEVHLFRDGLVPSKRFRKQAIDFIDKIKARGGTNINDALLRALSMVPQRQRPTSIIFLTDGLPTVGVTRVEEILSNVRRANPSLRIFPFGVGYDVNTRLLDALAESTHGSSDYIAPEENIEERVSEFFEKISRPVLADLELDFGDLEVEEFYPRQPVDLFIGSQVTVVGRYRKAGRGEVKLSGAVSGKRQTFRYDVVFPKQREDNDFLPRLWAARKIGYLVDQIRLHGESSELKKEIIELSKTYGVMSPYTSYLVQEDERGIQTTGVTPVFQPFAPSRSVPQGELLLMDSESAPDVGAGAVAFSKAVRRLKNAEVVFSGPPATGFREVGGRMFRKNSDGVWVDTAYDSTRKVLDLRAGSGAIVTLLTTYPKAGPFLALGKRVIFKLGEIFIKVGDSGRDRISAAELRRLVSAGL